LDPVDTPPGVGARVTVGRVSTSAQNGAMIGVPTPPLMTSGVKASTALPKVTLPLGLIQRLE